MLSKMKRYNALTVAGLGLFWTFVVVLVLACLLEGWVLSVLWSWFVVPLGLPAVGLWHGVGLAVMIHFITHQYVKQDMKPDVYQAAGYLVARPLVTLLAAWIIHFFM